VVPPAIVFPRGICCCLSIPPYQLAEPPGVMNLALLVRSPTLPPDVKYAYLWVCYAYSPRSCPSFTGMARCI